MRVKKQVVAAAAFSVAASIASMGTSEVRASDITKANTNNALNAAASWTGGVVPGANDVGVWNPTSFVSNTMGASLTFGGIRIGNVTGPVSINSNTAASTLTFGRFGLDMSAATQSLTVNAPISLVSGFKQDWNIASGQSVTVTTAMFGSNATYGSVNVVGSGTAVFNNANNAASALIGNANFIYNSRDFGGLDANKNLVAGTVAAAGSYVQNPSVTDGTTATLGGARVLDFTNFNAASTSGTTGGAFAANQGVDGFRFNTPVGTAADTPNGRLNWVVDMGARQITGDLNGVLVGADVDTNVTFTSNAVATNGFRISNRNAVFTLRNYSPTYALNINASISTASSAVTNMAKAGPGLVNIGSNVSLNGAGNLTNEEGILNFNNSALVTAATGSIVANGGGITVNTTNTMGSAPLAINANAYLGGTGVSGGVATINANGTLAPGNAGTNSGVGTLTLGGLTLGSGAISALEFGSGANDEFASTGTLTLSGSSFVALYQAGTTTPFSANGTYALGTYGAIAGNPASLLSVLPATQMAGKIYAFSAAGGTLSLNISGNTPSYWAVDADGTWGTASNWTAGIPDGSGAFAGFGTGGATATAPRTVTLQQARTVGTLSIDSASAFTISGGSLSLDNSGSAAAVTVVNGNHVIDAPVAMNSFGANFTVTHAADSLTLNQGLSGPAGLNKLGAGTLSITASTFAGDVSIAAGTLRLVGGANVIPATASANVAGTLDLNGTNQTLNAVTGTGSVTNGGTADSTLTFAAPPTVGFALSDGATNKLAVAYPGSGTTTLNLAQTYTGGTTLGAGGTIAIPVNSANGNTALGTGPLLLNNGSTLNISFAGSSSSVFLGNPTTIAAGANATITSGSQGNGFGQVFTFGDASSVLTIGNGNVSLSAAGSQFGASVGTVEIPSGSNIRFSSTSLNGNGGDGVTFDVAGSISSRNQGVLQLGALTGGGSVNSGTTTSTNSTLTLNIGGKNIDATFSGAINDGAPTANTNTFSATNHYAAVTKIGTGTQTLTGNLNYSGNTTVNGGKLVIATPWRPLQITNAGSSSLVVGTSGAAAVSVAGSGGYVTPLQVNGITVNGTLAIGATDRAEGGGNLPLITVANTLAVGNDGSGTYTGHLDLGNGDLLLHGTTADAVNAILVGHGLATSVGGTGSGRDLLAGVGVIQNSDGQGGALYSSFDGYPVAATDTLVKYTYLGDANLDGVVDPTDLSLALAGLNGGLTGWANGDFDHSGSVTQADIDLLLNSLAHQGASFGDSGGNGGGSGAVPEPSAAALGLIALPLLGRRRRRHA